MKCQHHSLIGKPCRNATALSGLKAYSYHEGPEGDSEHCFGQGDRALHFFMIFMPFVVTKLVRFFTMKNTKVLKETLTLSWIRKIEALCFFMPFMVDSLVWRLPILLHGWSVHSHSSVYRRSEVPTNYETGQSSSSEAGTLPPNSEIMDRRLRDVGTR